MPRPYADNEKHIVIERLKINRGDVSLTAQEFNLSPTTIYRWLKQTGLQLQQLQQLQLSDSSPPRPQGEGLGVRVGEVSTSLRDLQTQMLADAHVLAQSIQSAIADAPLGQRVAALAQLIDRIIKLAAQLPGESSEPDELIVRVARHVEKEDDDEEDNGLESAGRTPDPEENDEM